MLKPDKPGHIEKRLFTCTSCGYNAQVHGKQYFDYGCYNYMATFSCTDCKVLFESVISEMECPEPFKVTYNLADEEDIVCLSCGSEKNKVWSEETGLCPKCSGKMTCTVDGQIRVHHESDLK